MPSRLVLADAEENYESDVDALRAAGFRCGRRPQPARCRRPALRRLFRGALGTAEPDWLGEAEQVWARCPPTREVAVVPVWRKPWVVFVFVLGRDTSPATCCCAWVTGNDKSLAA